jgi:ADP-dependent NAD(P)H-hydrate dehydratase / NAD(P)H-hydrate epimerase
MKILDVEKIRGGDAYTIKHEPIADIDLMERAATACFYWLVKNIPFHKQLCFYCGTGNNGGDGFAIARMMAGKGYSVEIFLFGQEDKMSDSCRTNYQRAKETSGINISVIHEGDPMPGRADDDKIYIDAIFGSGLARPVTGFYAKIISHLNSCKGIRIAIDVPSGLFCDSTNASKEASTVVHADHTLTFAPPKLAFLFPENDKFVGKWELLEIGILQEYIDSVDTKNFYTDQEDCRKILRPRNKFSHKGTFGHALLFCGSLGKMGAAVLSARGCLHSGPGLVTVHVPKGGSAILQTAVPEAMLDVDEDDNIFSGIGDISRFSALAAGPGLGMADQTGKALKLLIQNATVPMIFDADAINILAENKTWISFVPKGSIFTPHPKEFERLVGKSSDDFERNRMQREFSVKHSVYLVLKGAHTAITTPEGKCWFNSTGNPGMATGGSGDVLTGMLAGLMAQGYTPFETCILGVYLHGLAGDLAAEEQGQEALIAGDIIENIGKAFKTLY